MDKTFDRRVFENIIKTEMTTPPEGVAQGTWTLWLFSLLDMATTTTDKELQNEEVFRGSIQYIRDRPDILTWIMGLIMGSAP